MTSAISNEESRNQVWLCIYIYVHRYTHIYIVLAIHVKSCAASGHTYFTLKSQKPALDPKHESLHKNLNPK